MELREGEISNGRSNGAMMRCSLLGLAFKPSEEEARRETVRQLAAATHQDASAQFAALMLSAVFSAIYEEAGSDIHSVLESEARALTDGGFPVEESWLERVMTHQPSDQGTQLDPLDTLGAVLWVVQAAPNLAEHFYISCDLGGDTDTVAALAGALGSLRFPNERLTDIQWFGEVNWAEVPLLQEFADILEAWRDK
jgi:ADP-ribosylglycohydrolase